MRKFQLPVAYRWAFILGVCGVVLSSCGWIQKGVKAFAEDDPRVTALTDFTPRLKVEKLWSASISNNAKNSNVKLLPLVRGNAVFVSNDKGHVSAIALNDGKRLWRRSFDVAVTFGVGAGGRVLMIGTADGEVIAFSSDKGEPLWRKRLTGGGITAISRSRRGAALVRNSSGGIIALKVKDGGQLWRLDTELPTLTLRGMSVPLLYKGSGFVGLDDGRLLIVSLADGRIRREFRIGLVTQGTDLDRLVDIDGQFRIYEGILYVAAYRGRMLAFDIDRGAVLWLTKVESYVGLDVDEDHVYAVGTAGEMRALDRFNGTEVWKNTDFAVRDLSAPLSFGAAVVVGDDRGYLYWVSRADGSILARESIAGGPILSAPVAWRGRVIGFGHDGDLAAVSITARVVSRSR